MARQTTLNCWFTLSALALLCGCNVVNSAPTVYHIGGGLGYQNSKSSPAVSVGMQTSNTQVKAIADEQHQAILIGQSLNHTTSIHFGGSSAKENNLKGHSVFGGATIAQPTKGINYVSVGAEHQYVGSADLWSNTTVNATEKTEINNNQKTTTTTTTTTTTNHKLQGGRSTTVRAEAGIKTTENGTAIVGVAHTTGHNPHNKDTALKAGYEHNFDNARVSATIDTNGYANGTLRTNLTNNLSTFVGAGKNIKHRNDEKIFAGLSYSFGSGNNNNNNNYTTQSRMDHIVGDFGLHSPQVASNLTNKTTYSTNTTINKIINKKTETIQTPTEPVKPSEPVKPTEPELVTKNGDSTTHKVPELEFNIEELVEQEFVKNFPGYPNIIKDSVDFNRHLEYNYHISNDFEMAEWTNWWGLDYVNIDNYFDPKVGKRFIIFTDPTDNHDTYHKVGIKHKKTGIVKQVEFQLFFTGDIVE